MTEGAAEGRRRAGESGLATPYHCQLPGVQGAIGSCLDGVMPPNWPLLRSPAPVNVSASARAAL